MCKNIDHKQSCWNEMEELKHLICAIDSCKCPDVLPSPTHSIMLPPRIQEVPCVIPSQRPVYRPPLPCLPPISPGPCCPCPLPRYPRVHLLPSVPALPGPCCPPPPLPCYPSIIDILTADAINIQPPHEKKDHH